MTEDVPHRVRYDSPKRERDTIPLPVESADKSRLKELESLADDAYDETVYVMDVRLAALRGGFSDDKLFLEEMNRIGYGYFD